MRLKKFIFLVTVVAQLSGCGEESSSSVNSEDTSEPNKDIPLNDGLVAYYEFEGNANDSSGNSNHGTEYGNINYEQGLTGQAANFNGLSYIQFDKPIIHAYDSSTISLWIKYDSVPTMNSYIIANGGETFSSEGISILIAGSSDTTCGHKYPEGAIEFSFAQKSTNTRICGKATMLPNQWHYVVTTRNNSNITLYIDGQKIKYEKSNFNSTFGLQNNMRIGSPTIFSKYLLKGKLDNIRLYNRVLNESEIQELYNL